MTGPEAIKRANAALTKAEDVAMINPDGIIRREVRIHGGIDRAFPGATHSLLSAARNGVPRRRY